MKWLLIVAIAVIGMWLNASVYSIVWNWYLVPGLGAPRVGPLTMFGVTMILASATIHSETKTGTFEEAAARIVSLAFLKPAIVLLVAWLALQIFG